MPPSAMIGVSVRRRRARRLRDRGDLRHAGAGDDAGRADRAGAHADLHRAHAGGDEVGRPLVGAHVAGDELEAGVSAPHLLDDRRGRPCCGRARCPPRRRPPSPRRGRPRARGCRAATPTAAPTRRRPSESLQACGYLICFWMSLTVMRPFRLKSRSTTRSFSTLCLWRISLASSRVVPTETVMRSFFVINLTGHMKLVYGNVAAGAGCL